MVVKMGLQMVLLGDGGRYPSRVRRVATRFQDEPGNYSQPHW
jgi:hypothetical protein